MPPSKTLGRDFKIKKKSPSSKKPARAAPPLTFKSSEFVQESDDEQPDISEKENNSDSDEESIPSNPADAVILRNGKLPRPAGSSSSSENESETDESGSAADDEDEEVEEPIIAFQEIVEVPEKKSTKPPSPSVVKFTKPPHYKPPVGFEKASLDGTPKPGHMFKKSSLEGKQIWYFTAPASLPVSSIGQISLKDVTDGTPITNHKGNEYGFIRDSAGDKTYTKILVPNGSDDGYRTAKRSIDQIFHVRASSNIAASASKATIPAKKQTIRQQPHNLKMRFRPIGFGDGETGKIGSSSSSAGEFSESSDESDEESSSSDVEMAEAPPLPKESIAKERRKKIKKPKNKERGVGA